MTTYSDPDATALAVLDYTIPPDYALSSDCTGAPAWSSSPLGDPAVDDDEFFDIVDRYGPEEWGLKPRPFRTGVAIAAVVLGALGVGAALGIAVRDFAGPPPSVPALSIPGSASIATPATPQAASPTVPAPAPAPAASPVHDAAPIPVVAAPTRSAAMTNRVVAPSGDGAPATAPAPASDAGTGAPDVAPPPAAEPQPHPSVIISIPAPPVPPLLPKFLPPPPPVNIQIPVPSPPVKFQLPAPGQLPPAQP
jgi:hypothetical protein